MTQVYLVISVDNMSDERMKKKRAEMFWHATRLAHDRQGLPNINNIYFLKRLAYNVERDPRKYGEAMKTIRY